MLDRNIDEARNGYGGRIPTNWSFIKDIDFHYEFNTLADIKINGMQTILIE